MKSILVATDLSDVGNRAIPYAFSLLPNGGIVYLLHVMKEPPLPNPMYAHYSSEKFLSPEEKKDKIEKIHRLMQELIPEEATKNFTTKIEITETEQQGGIADRILEAAEKDGVDAICLTLRDRKLLESIFFNSVGQAVIKKSHLPLFIVRSRE